MLPPAPERHARGAGMGDKRIIEQRIPAAARVAEARFPDSDGRFLPENDTQAEAILSVRYALTALQRSAGRVSGRQPVRVLRRGR